MQPSGREAVHRGEAASRHESVDCEENGEGTSVREPDDDDWAADRELRPPLVDDPASVSSAESLSDVSQAASAAASSIADRTRMGFPQCTRIRGNRRAGHWYCR
jgi:hypothetical protein